jgi:ABC-2 type transport system permease protein
MGIFTDNPVLEREVRGRLRLKRKGGVAANLWIARLIGAIAAYYYVRGMIGIWRGTLQDARDFWPLLVYGALVLIVLLSPALSATAITQEREQQTWEILATTQLSAWEVLGGKWLGRQMIPWLLVVILLPYMAVDAARAELGFSILPAVLGFLLVTIACYSALGLLCSFQAKRTMTATASALTVSAFLCIGTVIINQVWLLLANRSGPRQDTPVMWANPFYTVNTLMMQLSPNTFGSNGSNAPTSTLWYFLITVIATVAVLAFMVRRYHRSVRERS